MIWRIFNSRQSKKVGNSTIEFCPLDLRQLSDQFNKHRLLVAGEVHGVMQNYDIYKFLVEKLGVKAVGMEIPNKKFEFLKRLDQTSVKNPLVRLKLRLTQYDDGRFSESLLDFISYLKKMGVELFLFDNGEDGFNKSHEENAVIRDQAMAKDILAHSKNQKTLVIAGRYHTQSSRQGSMAHFVSQQRNFTEVELEYLSGKFHNFGLREFEESKNPVFDNIQFRPNAKTDPFKFIIPRASQVNLI